MGRNSMIILGRRRACNAFGSALIIPSPRGRIRDKIFREDLMDLQAMRKLANFIRRRLTARIPNICYIWAV
jgi:hypothetical protein